MRPRGACISPKRDTDFGKRGITLPSSTTHHPGKLPMLCVVFDRHRRPGGTLCSPRWAMGREGRPQTATAAGCYCHTTRPPWAVTALDPFFHSLAAVPSSSRTPAAAERQGSTVDFNATLVIPKFVSPAFTPPNSEQACPVTSVTSALDSLTKMLQLMGPNGVF